MCAKEHTLKVKTTVLDNTVIYLEKFNIEYNNFDFHTSFLACERKKN